MFSSQYSFCKFKIPEKGGRVIWELTNECNYGCKYCIFSSTGRKPVGELTREEVFHTLEELKKLQFSHIKFTGGEPFLREDLLDILKYANHLGFSIDLSTNASKINEIYAQQLSLLNLSYIHVSLDGFDQLSHEAVRGKKSFDPTVKGLTLLSQYLSNIRIGCVLHKFNEFKIQNMIDFFNSFSVEKIAFSIMQPAGRLKEKSDLLISRDIYDLYLELEEHKNKYPIVSHNLDSLIHIPKVAHLSSKLIKNSKNNDIVPSVCPGGEKFLFINSIGVVSPCTWVSEHKPFYHKENLKEKSLSHILMSETFQQFNQVKNLIAKESEICPMENIALFGEKEALC